MTGRDLSHYHVMDKLGEGGMGVVYKARDTRLDRFAAVKVLPADKMSDPQRKQRFVTDARAASALNHPNVVTIYDVGSEGDVDFRSTTTRRLWQRRQQRAMEKRWSIPRTRPAPWTS